MAPKPKRPPKRKHSHDPANDKQRWADNQAALEHWAAIEAEARATGQWPEDWHDLFPSTACSCQAGPTGYCQQGQHHKCPGGGGPRSIAVETFLCDHRGRVWPVHPDDTGRFNGGYEVWRTGTPCRYRCPCRCHAQVQLTLFDAD